MKKEEKADVRHSMYARMANEQTTAGAKRVVVWTHKLMANQQKANHTMMAKSGHVEAIQVGAKARQAKLEQMGKSGRTWQEPYKNTLTADAMTTLLAE